MFNSTTGEHSPFVKVEKTTGDVNANFSIKAAQQGLSAGNACDSEIAGQKLHELKLHETITVYGGEHLTIQCMRVPGGFIYQYSEYHPSENEHLTVSTVFVPEPVQLEYCTTQKINMDKLFEE